MKLRAILPGLSLLIGLAAFGCGGGSSSSGGIGGGSNTNAVFKGSYVGPFTNSGTNTDTGEFAINVSSSGAITGRYIDITAASTGTTSSGQITFVSSTAATDTGSVTTTDAGGTASGNLTLSGGTLSGSIVNKTTGVTINFTSGLVSTANANLFAGFYNGTYTVNGAAGTPSNTAALIIDGNGKITGLFADSIAGQSGNDGIGLGTIVSSTGATTIGQSTGTLRFTYEVLGGTTTQFLSGTLVNSSNAETMVLALNVST